MALKWTRPPTFKPGDRLRAPQLNALLRDNMLYLHDQPSCAVRRTSDLNVWSGEDTVVRFSQAVYDTHKMWDPGVPARVKIPLTGIYSISIRMLWDGNGDGARHVRIRDHRGEVLAGDRRQAVSPTEVAFSIDTSLAVDNWIELDVRQTSGETVVLRGAAPRSVVMTVRRVGAGPDY